MSVIRSSELPLDSLLQHVVGSGAYADCYTAEIARSVSQAEFVEAFYTTTVFKVERFILRMFADRPSTDSQAGELARGERDSFAAWSVEGRCANQLLLRDFTGRTRSWLMVSALHIGQSRGTRLYFGSAVIASRDAKTGRSRMGFAFAVLLGFHRLYSRVLLRAAKSRLLRGSTQTLGGI